MINPSLVDNMPISILESLASGVPVITTNVGGIPFVVEHETSALLVAPADPGAMANAMLRVLDNPELAAKLAAEGAREVQKYTWKSVRETLLAVYESALSHRVLAEAAQAR
jgi:glycosyltransferase involved in cell wall biosynthesis